MAVRVMIKISKGVWEVEDWGREQPASRQPQTQKSNATSGISYEFEEKTCKTF